MISIFKAMSVLYSTTLISELRLWHNFYKLSSNTCLSFINMYNKESLVYIFIKERHVLELGL
jgi:hypothetical protein